MNVRELPYVEISNTVLTIPDEELLLCSSLHDYNFPSKAINCLALKCGVWKQNC